MKISKKTILIKEALELRSFAEVFKGQKSVFGFACLQFWKQICVDLQNYEMQLHYKKIELALKGENGEVLENERGGFLANAEGKIALQEWQNDKVKELIEITCYIVDDYQIIKDNLEAIDLVNGILIDVNINDLILS